jgi:ClpP class serine protease
MEDIVLRTSIKGVVLRINSLGGSVGPTVETARSRKLKEKEVFVSDGLRVGGYYPSAAGGPYASPRPSQAVGVIRNQ